MKDPLLPSFCMYCVSHIHQSVSRNTHLSDLGVDVKVLGDTSVETQTLVGVEITGRVVGLDALLMARLNKSVEHVGDHIELGLCGEQLLGVAGSVGVLASESKE